jgi:Peptidase family M1 domain
LFLDAESDYTSLMKLGVTLLGLCVFIVPAVAYGADRSPRELYDALNASRVDPTTTYQLEDGNRIELRRSDVQLTFDEGKLAFFAPLDGRITGIVFSGRGHALAVPRGTVEKQQMAHFLGSPVLDQSFNNALLRFTDDTADELLRQLQHARITPKQDTAFAARWNPALANLNPGHSLRILFDHLTQKPRPYFYAGIEGIAIGPFDVVLDYSRDEQVLLGQVRKFGERTFYDVWASYKVPDAPAPLSAFQAVAYAIDTSILPSNALGAKADIRMRSEAAGERLLIFQLSPRLNVDSVSGDHGEPLTFFQNEGMSVQERSARGNTYLYVVLPEAPPRDTEFTLHFRYRGNVIDDAGNGVLFVGARECWYPHFGNAADFASYDLSFRWPRRLRLVATGTKIEEHEDGDIRGGHWKTEKPVSVAGFNLGEYVSSSLNSAGHSIDLYANRQLELSLRDRLTPAEPDINPILPTPFGVPAPAGRIDTQSIAPSPADALKALGRQIDSSIRFYETFSGPFPFQKLSVSQIPGTFGQGWPGLLYISTFSFLPAAAQQRAGLSESVQQHFTDVVPYHEVAHQWWGNVVGWGDYRDQWIDEAIANYLASMFADTQKNPDHTLRLWLDRYRRQLLDKNIAGEQPGAEIGALELGSRLSSSKSPSGFEEVIYPKGTWVMHMLREMLRQPGAKNPDARFIALLRAFSTKYAYRALSTQDLQREVEAVMTPAMDLEGGHSMDWFFEQWVRGTGIPRYHVEFTVHQSEKGYAIKGKLLQEGVPKSFIAQVPLYAKVGSGRSGFLGNVVAAGPETTFHFTTQLAPHKIVIDPQMTLLCVTE